MEKAYDLTWRYGIIKDIYHTGLRGRLAKFIVNFLKERNFKVKVNNILSENQRQEEGIPQGSVVSPTLFILRINKLAQLIPKHPRFQMSLFMDDLQVSYRDADMQNIETNLQNCINVLQKYANENGFKFSATKTAMMVFETTRSLTPPPSLLLNNNVIPKVESVKFLGMTWDTKLNWKKTYKRIKSKMQQRAQPYAQHLLTRMGS